MNDLLHFFYSLVLVRDRERLIDDIEVMKRNLFSVDSKEALEKSLLANVAEDRAHELFAFLTQHNKRIEDSRIIEEILESLRQRLAELEIAKLYLSITLNENEIQELHKKLCSQLKEHILLKVQIDRALIGGLKLEYRGVFIDRSLATTIKKISQQTPTA